MTIRIKSESVWLRLLSPSPALFPTPLHKPNFFLNSIYKVICISDIFVRRSCKHSAWWNPWGEKILKVRLCLNGPSSTWPHTPFCWSTPGKGNRVHSKLVWNSWQLHFFSTHCSCHPTKVPSYMFPSLGVLLSGETSADLLKSQNVFLFFQNTNVQIFLWSRVLKCLRA